MAAKNSNDLDATGAEDAESKARDAVRSALYKAIDAVFQVRALVSIARLGAANLDNAEGDGSIDSEAMEGAQVVERTLRCAEEQADRVLAALNAAESALLAR